MENVTNTQNFGVHVGGRRHVQPAQVVMLVADSNYTTIFLNNGQQFMVATTIGKILKSLENYGQFIRPNRSHVLNLDFVKLYNSKELLLKNGERVRFSRRRGKISLDFQ